jgi:hypothetical protein
VVWAAWVVWVCNYPSAQAVRTELVEVQTN